MKLRHSNCYEPQAIVYADIPSAEEASLILKALFQDGTKS